MGVWELKYQLRQSEKMLRGCEVVHLGVVGSDITGISHVHQKPLPPKGSVAFGMKRAVAGVQNTAPQPLATTSALLATMSARGPPCPNNHSAFCSQHEWRGRRSLLGLEWFC